MRLLHTRPQGPSPLPRPRPKHRRCSCPPPGWRHFPPLSSHPHFQSIDGSKVVFTFSATFQFLSGPLSPFLRTWKATRERVEELKEGPGFSKLPPPTPGEKCILPQGAHWETFPNRSGAQCYSFPRARWPPRLRWTMRALRLGGLQAAGDEGSARPSSKGPAAGRALGRQPGWGGGLRRKRNRKSSIFRPTPSPPQRQAFRTWGQDGRREGCESHPHPPQPKHFISTQNYAFCIFHPPCPHSWAPGLQLIISQLES